MELQVSFCEAAPGRALGKSIRWFPPVVALWLAMLGLLLALTLQAQAPAAMTVVSGASFSGPELAPESVAAAFGQGFAPALTIAQTTPLPVSLAGVTVTVRDSANVNHAAGLFFVAPGQAGFLVPREVRRGPATVTLSGADGKRHSATVTIADVAPALFSANASGCGVAAALATQAGADGSQTSQLVFRYDEARGRNVAAPVDLGAESDVVVLSLYGTGFRLRSSPAAVSVRIGGQNVDVLYAGAQPEFPGLDQLNVQVPRSLAGRPEVEIAVTVDGKSANVVSVNLGGQTPAPRIASVSPNTVQSGQSVDLTITGENLLGAYRIRVAPAQGVTATVVRTTATTVTARLAVAADAAAGERQVSVESDRGESGGAPLSIRPAVLPPRITALTPTGANAGQTVADLSIDGENLAAVTAVEFTPAGTGITVSNLRRTAAKVTVTVEIALNAALGNREVRVVSPGGRSNALNFEVRARPSGPFTISNLKVTGANKGRDSEVSFSVDFDDPSGSACKDAVHYFYMIVGGGQLIAGGGSSRGVCETGATRGRVSATHTQYGLNWVRGIDIPFEVELTNALGTKSNELSGTFRVP